jgi:hypothetical protein
MFTILTLLIGYSLLTFGAVLPNSWLLLKILWLGGIAGCLLMRTLRGRKLDARLVVLFALAAVLFEFTEPKLAVGFVAAAWAWAAAGRSESRTLRFLRVLLLIGLVEALLGLVQFFISPGWIFGYISPFYRSSGTLINHNHYAGLLEMLVPLALGFAYIAVRRYSEMARPYTYILAGAFMGLSLVFSESRMGIFSLMLTLSTLAVLVRVRDSKERWSAGLGFGLLVLVTAGALWIGLDVIVARYSGLVGEEAILREGRVLVFRDTIHMITANPSGIGTGHYQDRFREYQTFKPELLFDHAHNDYLETMAEWGTPVAMGFWCFILFVLVSAIRAFWGPGPPERRGILLACIGAIFSILVHSLADFNLQIPSNAMLFFTFVGIAAAYSFHKSSELAPDDQ